MKKVYLGFRRQDGTATERYKIHVRMCITPWG